MPSAPPRKSSAPKRKAWSRKSITPTVRIRGRKGQEIRNRHLASEPLCRECRKQGVIREADVVDHILALAEGGTETDDNRQSLCHDHHNAKSAAESKRAYGKAHPAWLPKSSIPLTIVCGSPGSGKTTYVDRHAKPDDTIICLDLITQDLFGHHGHQRRKDEIGACLFERNRRLARLEHASTGCAWFIVGAPTDRERQWWKEQLGAKDVILLDPGLDTCLDRIGASLKRCTAAEDWHRRRFETWTPPK